MPGLYPEHTTAGYEAAHVQGADFNELDLQVTKDGHLICSHDPTLKSVTDIEDHPEFADRKGHFVFGPPYNYNYTNDWLINDFTLEELLTLRKKERYSKRNQALNGIF